VLVPDGSVASYGPLRAAFAVARGEVRPHKWTPEDLDRVTNAVLAWEQEQRDLLRAAQLLVDGHGPEPAEPGRGRLGKFRREKAWRLH
jgi:hypothetical protein